MIAATDPVTAEVAWAAYGALVLPVLIWALHDAWVDLAYARGAALVVGPDRRASDRTDAMRRHVARERVARTAVRMAATLVAMEVALVASGVAAVVAAMEIPSRGMTLAGLIMVGALIVAQTGLATIAVLGRRDRTKIIRDLTPEEA
ncbi:MAG TPA: hypothetical protein PLR44_14110 [Thermomicrobiales bacterium]|nr:hypothetical protein [Thermomicrobiales bacterium]HRA32745.1 hypothetical protein [Thermomicrobiales bacterium]